MNTEKDISALPRLMLKDRQLYDLELLLVGGFSPLTGFMNETDYQGVVENMRLSDGTLFPMPIVLDVPSDTSYKVGDQVVLTDPFWNPLAIMTIESRYQPDKEAEMKGVYGTTDDLHPGVRYLRESMHDTYIGGSVEQIGLPQRGDFKHLRHTPAELKQVFKEKGWDKVIGFQTRNPMHRAHFEIVKRAHEKVGAPVLIHPVVGMTKPGDIDYVSRVRTYNVICRDYGKDFTHLSLLPLAMRMGGPREALWHAIIRKNYGCTHFISGRDHAGPGKDANGVPFYEPFAARDLLFEYADEIGIVPIDGDEIAYSTKREAYVATTELEQDETTENISGTDFRRMLHAGEDIPEWFSFPESITILKQVMNEITKPGTAILFTGLPCSGKTTIAELLVSRLQEIQGRKITYLDGDVIRTHLSKGLTFSKEDRDENVKRVGFVAGEIAKHGGFAICSLVSPYQDARTYMRNMVEDGNAQFVEIHIATELAVCEKRDVKGMYAKARAGEIKDFTGVDDPYEIPENPELRLDTVDRTPEELVEEIIAYLQEIDSI